MEPQCSNYVEPQHPKYEMLRKILTAKVEYADFGGEENFIKEESVLAETFQEAESKLASYLDGRQYHVISWCWKNSVIDDVLVSAGGRSAGQETGDIL